MSKPTPTTPADPASSPEPDTAAGSRSPAPTLQIKMFPLGTVGKWPKNPKKHDVEGLILSMQKYGFVQPVALDKTTNRLYAGHGREEALLLMQTRGMPPPKGIVVRKGEWWLPVLTGVSFKSEKEAEQYVVADNQLTIVGGWENQDLLDIIKRQETADVRIMGFDAADVRKLMQQADKESMRGKDRSDPPPPPTGFVPPPQAKRGDVFELAGGHRVMCGEAADVADIRKLCNGVKIQVLCTDPPYNVGSEDSGFAADVSKSHLELMAAEWDRDFDPGRIFPLILDFMADDCTVYIFTQHHLFGWYVEWMKMWSDHSSYCMWAKPDPMPSLSKRHWTWDGELIAYATRGKHTFNFPDGEHAPSTWRISKSVENRIHPTQKPVEVFQHPLRHSALPGFVCADFFAGSGSSLIAGDRLGMKMLLMERDPARVDLLLARWNAYVATKK